ncbi:transglycosylase domain-containing protein [Corallococcus sp. bb12-1]|uniref:transglycosylase domain-containing protein n=1 Tax=Corallococcus sp. bb12-1 TaxID=2996784 RepID=UPI00226D7330|nr:transglycosylase domain-containing protein [Corallococcus sp. bb12-1]MCY1040154.1 transglycosylase domain-containing protein [Corallococcus sp. bb12-1]
MRLLGLGLWGLGLVGVGLLAAMEGFYRLELHRLPELPTPPEATDRLPAKLARTWWSLFEPGATLTVEPVWPWTVVATVSRPLVSGSPPPMRSGWSLASAVADSWEAHPSSTGEPLHLKWPQRLALGIWLTRHWSAEELLAFQARHVKLGHDVIGVSEGARRYLAKETAGITFAEAALLTSIAGLGGTQRAHPECFIDRLQPRRDRLIQRLREAGAVTHAEEAAARSEPVVVRLADFDAHPCPR